MSWLDPLLAIKTQQAGTTAGTRQTINFASGATVTDDPANDRVNVAIAGGLPGVTVTGTPTAGQTVVASSASAASWGSVPRGSVANTSGAAGDLITGDATTLGRLAIGSTGQVLTVSGGAPVWAAPSAGASVAVGPYASRPAATAGATYYPTDGWCHYVGDGATWRPVIGGVAGTQPPVASTFTAVNMSATSTLTDNNGALVANDETTTTALPDFRIWHASLGASTNVEACVLPAPTLTGMNTTGQSYQFGGICLRENATGKLVLLFYSWAPGGPACVSFERALSATSSRVLISGNQVVGFSQFGNFFIRLRISSGNVIAEYSGGRGAFFNIGTVALTTAFTAAPDQYGLSVWPYGGGPTSTRIVVPHLATY